MREHKHDHGHSHGHHHHEHGHSHGQVALSRALVVTVIFLIVEVICGFLANSLALISDAGHMLTDVGGILLSLFVVWVARRPATRTMSFGYHRAEILGALGSGLSIWVLAGVLIFEAAQRIQTPQEVQAPLVIAMGALGLLANLISMKFLHSEQKNSLNVRGAYLHVIYDALGSVGALIAGIVLWRTGWSQIDAIVTFFLAALMLWGSWSLVRDSVMVLMESTPGGIDPLVVQSSLEKIEGVREVHDLHIWTVSSGRLALSVHIISDQGEQVLTRANEALAERFKISHTTIQIEHPEKFQSERCYDCAPV